MKTRPVSDRRNRLCFISQTPTALINHVKVATLGLGIAGCLVFASAAFASQPIITTFTAVAPGAGVLRMDNAGNIYTTTGWGCSISKITPAGVVSNFAGNGSCGYGGDGGLATNAQISPANNLALDSQDNLYIADYYNHCIRKVDKNTNVITTFAGQCGVHGLSGDGGLATSATLLWPHGLGIDNYDNVYIGGDEGHTIRKVHHATKIITTIAGTGGWGDSASGEPAYSARLGTPVGINFDQNNNMVIADNAANRIRKITALSGNNSGGNIADGISGEDLISTLAGVNCSYGYGACGYGGDGGPAVNALINQPETAIFGPDGNVYITDSVNVRVRMIDQYGIITTVAGSGSWDFSGDGGPATEAGIGGVFGIVFDNTGNLYLTSTHPDGRHIIRKVTFSTVPEMCVNPAVYDVDTKKLSIPALDLQMFDPITGRPTGIGVFYAELMLLEGIEDFRFTHAAHLQYTSDYNPRHAYYKYNDGIYGNGGRLVACVSVPQVIVIPPGIVIPAPPLLYKVVMRNLAIYPEILHVESIELIP